MERTEEEKILQSAFRVTLGGREYEIKPLVIRESREWRKKVVAAFGKLPEYVNMTTDDPAGFTKALSALLSDMPDTVVELFFSYAKDLNRDEIEATATDTELAKAFEEVMAYAFPLSQSLTKVLGRAQA